MSKSNLNQKFDDYVAKLPRTGFDIGRDFYFTSAPGMILPVFQHILQPSESVHLDFKMKTTTCNLLRPAFLDIPQKIDVFFVPMDMLYTYFGNIVYQTNDYVSSGPELYSQASSGSFPVCSLQDIFDCDTTAKFFDSSEGFLGLSDSDPVSDEFECAGKSFFRLAMHLGLNPYGFMADFGASLGDDDPVFNQSTYDPNVFPAFFAAYQAIYENWYRDDDREPRDLRSYQLDYMTAGNPRQSLGALRYHSYHRDYFQSVRVSPISSMLNTLGGSDASSLTGTLQKVNNYLSNVPVGSSMPSFVSLPSTNSIYQQSYPLDSSNNFNFTQFSSSSPSSMGLDGDEYPIVSLSTGTIRSLFAVEKLNRIAGRARKNYDSQVLAHLGYKVPTDVKHQIRFLGGFDGNVGVKQIDSTANTATDSMSNLGERVGQGLGQLSGRAIDFTAPCHGVLMAVYYAVPEFSYPLQDRFDKLNALTNRLDLPIPEFDRLGMQPMFVFEGGLSSGSNTPTLPYGWQYRYEQYKRKYNVHTAVFYRDFVSENPDDINDWSSWLVGKNPYESMEVNNGAVSLPLSSFLCAPTCLNDIFVMPYDPMVIKDFDSLESGWYNHSFNWYKTDPFMHALRVDCKLVSFMSTTGEPELL